MLSFLLGTDEALKAEEIYRQAQADAQNNKSVFILVPEQYSMCAEEELLGKLGLSAQNKIQVLTFSRLVNMIFSKLGPLRTKYIDKAGKYLLACRSLQLCQNELSFFDKNVAQRGFGSLIVSLISELKRYGVSADDLAAHAQNFPDGLISAKLSDLSILYKKFDELLSENWVNAEDNLALALSKIPEADFLTGHLYINYFRSFTPLEYQVIEALLKKMDVTATLSASTLSDDHPVFSVQYSTYHNLCEICSRLGIDFEAPVYLDESKATSSNPEILHLKQNYFLPKPKKYLGTPENVHIARPQNRYAEVEYAARLIIRLCRTKGYCFSDFLILTGSPESYELILPAIFQKFGISFFLDQKLKLSKSPFMRMILSILEILAFGFSYERIMAILRSGFWDIEKSETDIFENYLLAADITHKQWRMTDDWVYNPDVRMFDMELVNRIKRKTVNKILDLSLSFSGRKTVNDIAKHLFDWLNSISMPKTVEDKISSFNADFNHERSEELSRVWNSFISLINQISDCMSDTYVTFTEFYELFLACSSELSIGIIPPTQDKVTISETSRFRTTGAKVVIVLGVLDKSFPQSYSAEGILTDSERLALKDAGLILAPDAYSRQKEEQFLVYSVFGAAKEELYLSSPVCDLEGKSLGSSEIIKRISTSIFPNISIEEDTDLDLIEGKDHTFFELCAKLFECSFDTSRLPELWQSVYTVFNSDEYYSKRLSEFYEMYNLEDDPDVISKQMAKALYGTPLTLSVSKLEKYNSCAFSFFMKYGLLANERLLGGLKATDTGTILHDILRKYFENKSNQGFDYSTIKREDCFREISSLVNDFAKNSDNAMFDTSNYYKYILVRLKNIAATSAWKLVQFYSKSKFRPSGFEVSFGEHGTLPPYKLSTKDGEVFLKGFIDKVDSANIEGKNYIAITDYKSSEKKMDADMIDKGVTLQPLIYANAIAKQTPDAKPAALMYMQMTDPLMKFENPPSDEEWELEMSNNIKVHGLFLDKPEVLDALDPHADDKNTAHFIACDKKSRLIEDLFEKRLSDAESSAIQTAENISSGIISPEPPKISGFDPCQYCPYGSVCKKD